MSLRNFNPQSHRLTKLKGSPEYAGSLEVGSPKKPKIHHKIGKLHSKTYDLMIKPSYLA